jgi:xylan 1,4-beta-xylosidase
MDIYCPLYYTYTKKEHLLGIMMAQHEIRKYSNQERVWLGKYKNLVNLPHWHYDCELICVDTGSALVTIDNKTYTLQEGDALFVSSKKVHYIKSKKDSILSFFLFDDKLVKEITSKKMLINPLLIKKSDVMKTYNEILALLNEKPDFYDISANNKIIDLMISIFRNSAICTTPAVESPMTKQYRKLLNEIDNKFDIITFSQAAEFMCLSQSYFSRLFRKLTNMSFTEYISYVRIEKAIEMIKYQPTLTVTEIAMQCGFDTIRNFNRVFKKLTGFSPKATPSNYVLFNTHPYTDKPFNPTLAQSELII